ncbi:MAG: FAD-binding oxidoreductase, partial [Proteobacteria bacterium]
MKDYLIVGSGLAGIAFAETALKNERTVHVISDHSQHSSHTAAGVYNPVILKRYSKLEGAQQQLDVMQEFYSGIQQRLGIDCNYKMPVLRRFASIEEQNNWFIASDNDGLSQFMSPKLHHNKVDGIDSSFGFGKVLQTGYVDTANFLAQYEQYLTGIGAFQQATFDFELLEINTHGVSYKDHQARHIIFAEGFGIKSNPYFNYLPLEGTKGELITIRAQIDVNAIVKAGICILPIGKDLFKVGATYNWDDKTERTTVEAREELVQKLKEVLTLDFEIVDQKAGIRPTVKDRKPLIGTHPD